MLLALVFCAFKVSLVAAYNVDTSSYRVLKGPEDNSYFGYSLASASINGSITIWSGSPKYSSDRRTGGGGKEGGIFQCDISQTEDLMLPKNCKKLHLKTGDTTKSKATSNGTDNDEDASSSTQEALPKCSFEEGFCNYTMEHSDFWLNKTQYQFRSPQRPKFNRNVKGTRTRCYSDIEFKTRLTGPPSYTVHEGMIAFDSDKATKKIEVGQNITTRLSTQRVEAKRGITQCLRFCFNAYSRLDENTTQERHRSLRVYLKYNSSLNQRDIFLYQGPRDLASKFWNFTEINVDHNKSESYKLYFEITVLKNQPHADCTIAADIVLTDITVSNTPCQEDPEEIDILEGEQSIGMTLNVDVDDSKTSTLSACGPLWQQNCGFAKEAAGICYQMKTNSSKPTVIKNPGLKGCIRGKIDIVLLVDQSASVNQCNFQKVKRWLRNIVRGFAIGQNEQDLGIVIYSSANSTKDIFQLGFQNYENSGKEKKRRMLEDLRKLPYEAGKTYTGIAFQHANQMLWGPNARQDAKKMVILLTDGETSQPDQDNLHEQTTITRRRNATILAVGVAGFNEAELISISGDERNFFSAKDFSELEKVRDTLRQTVSHSNLEGSRRSKSMQNCQMGFSIHSGKDALLIGAPGCFDRAGDVMRFPNRADKEDIEGSAKDMQPCNEVTNNTTLNSFAPTGNFTTSIMDDCTESLRSPENIVGIPTLDDLEEAMRSIIVESYLGYAVTSGEFFGPAAGVYVAASAPRHKGTGAVLIYKSDSTALISDSHILLGMQFGEYFGAVLCAEDVNSDKFTDLFVGAPLHSDANPDEGIVYVYMGGKRLSDKPDAVLVGSRFPFSRFGLVITSVGDVTMDGYKDIVVSSPHEENDKGAVYIFRGGEGEMISEYSQRIAASSFEGKNNFRLFGQSVSGGVDIDKNKYPDILVGTPGSDEIVILRTRPVVRVEAQFRVDSPMIDRRNHNCWMNNASSDNSCIGLIVCFSYSGMSVLSRIRLRYEIHPDVMMSTPRVAFRGPIDSNTVHGIASLWNPNTVVCSNYTLHLKKNILDMMTNVTMRLTYDMLKHLANDTETPTDTLRPVLDMSTLKTRHATTFFKTYCEDTSSCVADISINRSGPVSCEGDSIRSYVMSQEKLVRFSLKAFNTGPEEAHAVLIAFRYPKLLVFSSIAETDCFRILEYTEGPTGTSVISTVSIVLVKGFLEANTECFGILNFLATPTLLQSRQTLVTFSVNASTVSRDDSLEDNLMTSKIPLEYQTVFVISGRSHPEIVSGYQSPNSTDPFWATFSHVYTITNTGPFIIQNLSLSVEWPTCARNRGNIYYVRHKRTTFWRGQLTKNNQSEPLPIENDILLGNDSSICEEHNASGSDDEQVLMKRSSGCRSVVVTICPLISRFVENVFPRQHININLTGEIELTQFKNSESNVHVTSFISVHVHDNAPLKFSKEQVFQQTVATTVYPPYVNEITRDVKNDKLLPFWVYIISILVGLLLLIVVICLLRWRGFFESKYAKMKKEAQEDLQESTPMNPTA